MMTIATPPTAIPTIAPMLSESEFESDSALPLEPSYAVLVDVGGSNEVRVGFGFFEPALASGPGLEDTVFGSIGSFSELEVTQCSPARRSTPSSGP